MKRLTLVFAALFFFASAASCEDTKKLMQMIQKMGNELKEMIAKESLAREKDKAMMLSRLDELSGTKTEPEKTVVKRPVNPRDELLIESYLERLKEGNARFVKGKRSAQNFVRQRSDLTAGQQPYAIILGCSDSRVPPEFVFDESLGQLFTVRDEGTMADSAALGSIEFAAQRYHVKLLVILGHTACDAMNPPGAATAQRSSPAVGKAKISDGSETTRAEIIQHVHQQIDACRMHSTVLRDLIDNNELKVVGAVYNLDTGEVEFQ